MPELYTKNGIPLSVRSDRIYNPAGENFGYVRSDRVFGLNGRYRGTIVGDRLIYRPTGSAGGTRTASPRIAPAMRAPRGASPLWGDEPNIDP
jgi:hypothetical protein